MKLEVFTIETKTRGLQKWKSALRARKGRHEGNRIPPSQKWRGEAAGQKLYFPLDNKHLV